MLAIGAHPDDVEVGVGGILIDLSKRGYRCAVVILTRGEMGTGGNAEVRAAEVKQAAHILGVDIVRTFDWGDTALEDTLEHRAELADVIRTTGPRVMLAPYPQVSHGRRQSHPDHVAAGLIAINAANLASLKKADLSGDPYLVRRTLHYFLPPKVPPTIVVDITRHFDQWVKALAAHESQFLNPGKSRDYIEHISAMARSFGIQAGCKYGQGLWAAEPIRLRNLLALTEQPGD